MLNGSFRANAKEVATNDRSGREVEAHAPTIRDADERKDNTMDTFLMPIDEPATFTGTYL
jgi:hypothetical protein